MLFWIFMLLSVLMIPLTMIYFGRRFFKSPPKSINATFGYRSTMSMKNQETWKLAHTVCGRYWTAAVALLPLWSSPSCS
ncbi:MAG: SdpI family protein [Christensenellales bacterium]